MKTIKLAKGVEMPVLGLGTWNLKSSGCIVAVKEALSIGYRLIDTAEMYGNHKQIAQAIKESGIKRNDIFITTKVPPYKLWKNIAIESAKKYCQELGTDYLDLLLIHWPNPFIKTAETLDVFEKLQKEGVIRAYGVSNFGVSRLEKVLKDGYKVVNDQVKFHPSHNEKELKEFCDNNKVVVTAYSPISQGKDLRLTKIMELAKKYKRSEAQVILNWEISKGMVTIPKAAKKEHLEDNFKTLEWQLSPDDVAIIDKIS